MAALQVVYGYHGTSQVSADSILAQQRFEPSVNEYDWLGYGTYFFQESPASAWDWATRMHDPEPAVLRATITVADFMDLLYPDLVPRASRRS